MSYVIRGPRQRRHVAQFDSTDFTRDDVVAWVMGHPEYQLVESAAPVGSVELLLGALRDLIGYAARETGVPESECVAGPIGKAREAVAEVESRMARNS